MDLKLALTLDAQRCLEGESVAFSLTLHNAGSSTLEDLPSLMPLARAVHIQARARGGRTIVGYALGMPSRDGKFQRIHGLGLEPMSLGAGEKKTLAGDLLTWCGTLPADEYTIQAVYRITAAREVPPIVSAEIALAVLPAHVVAVSVPRLPEMPDPAPLTAVWRNGKPGEDVALLQLQSRVMPPNPYRCVRIGQLPADCKPQVATPSVGMPPNAHIAWSAGGQVQVLEVPTDKASKNSPTAVKTGLSQPTVLSSPRTTTSGGLLMLLTNQARDHLALVDDPADKPATVTEWPLERCGPLGIYNVFWTLDDDGLLVWSSAESREVFAARLIPGDVRDNFVPRQVAPATPGLVAIEVLRSDLSDDFFREGMHLVESRGQDVPIEEPVPESRPSEPPAYTLFLLEHDREQRQLVLRRVPLGDGQPQVMQRWSLAEEIAAGPLEVVQSQMTAEQEPVFLLRDSQGAYLFASTAVERIEPLSARVGRDVSPAHFPCLMAASQRSDAAWVYLRLFEPGEASFVFEKLEPADRDSTYKVFEFGDELP